MPQLTSPFSTDFQPPCRSSSVYFQNAYTTRPESSARVSTLGEGPTITGPESNYSSSNFIRRPGTSRPSTARPTTRPSTASGRKSRNSAAPSILGLSESHNIVCAVSEARGVSPSVGVAFVDVSIGEVIISQICDNQSYVKTIHKIQISAPSHILFMSTACPPNTPSTFFSLVQDLIPEAQIQTLDRSAWSESEGLENIKSLAFRDDVEPLKVATQGKFYAISSFAAVSTKHASCSQM